MILLTIYADVLVIVNLYVDFFLLSAVRRALKLNVKTRRIALGALCGAACSLTALIPGIPSPAAFPLAAAAGALTAAAAFCPIPPGTFLRAALCFWAFSLGLAGFLLFITRFLAPGRIAVFGSAVYIGLSPAVLFFSTCAAYGLLRLARRLLPKPGGGFMRIRAVHNGVSAELFAKADTGNGLREPFSGEPVIVCQRDAVSKLLPPAVANFPAAPEGGLRLVPFDSIGGSGLLPAFRPDSLTAEGRELSCWLAVTDRPLSAGSFNAIYNPDDIPEIREHGGRKNEN